MQKKNVVWSKWEYSKGYFSSLFNESFWFFLSRRLFSRTTCFFPGCRTVVKNDEIALKPNTTLCDCFALSRQILQLQLLPVLLYTRTIHHSRQWISAVSFIDWAGQGPPSISCCFFFFFLVTGIYYNIYPLDAAQVCSSFPFASMSTPFLIDARK